MSPLCSPYPFVPCPMPYSDRKVHACSEGRKYPKKRKKKRDERRSIEYALTALLLEASPPRKRPARCMSAAFHLANAGIRSPPICHPVLSVPRHRHRWRHATPRQHPHRKSLTLFSGPATGPARGLIMSRSNQHARRLPGGVGWFT